MNPHVTHRSFTFFHSGNESSQRHLLKFCSVWNYLSSCSCICGFYLRLDFPYPSRFNSNDTTGPTPSKTDRVLLIHSIMLVDIGSQTLPRCHSSHFTSGLLYWELRIASGRTAQQTRSGSEVGDRTSRILFHEHSVCLIRSSKQLLLNPVVISRNQNERIFIEGSVNSVRISVAVKQVAEHFAFTSAHPSCLIR